MFDKLATTIVKNNEILKRKEYLYNKLIREKDSVMSISRFTTKKE
jgi:hypothetical protein